MKKKILIIGLLLLVLLALPIVATSIFNVSFVREWITEYVSDSMGTRVSLEKVGITWNLKPEIYFEGIRVSEVDWGDYTMSLRAGRIQTVLSLIDLFNGKFDSSNIEMDHVLVSFVHGRPVINPEGAASTAETHDLTSAWIGRHLKSLQISNSKINYADETDGWQLNIRLLELVSLDEHSSQVFFDGNAFDTPLFFSGRSGDIKEVLSGQHVPIALDGYFGDVNNSVSITGFIEDATRGYGLNLMIKGHLVNLSELSSLSGLELPSYPSLTGEMQLIQPGNFHSMRLQSIDIRGAAYGPNIRITGSVGQVIGWQDIDLQLDINGSVTEPRFLELPGVEDKLDIELQGRIYRHQDEYGFIPSRAVLHTNGVKVSLGGEIKNFREKKEITLKLNASISEHAAFVVPSSAFLFPLIVDADLYIDEKSLDVRNIKVQSMKRFDGIIPFYVEGDLYQIGKNQTGHFQLQLSFLKAGLEALIGNGVTTEETSLSASAAVEIVGTNISLSDIIISASAPGVELTGTGSYGSHEVLENAQLEIELGVDSLNALNGLLNQDLPATGPLVGHAALKMTDNKKLVFDNIALRLDDPRIQATATGQFELSETGTFTKLSIHSDILDLAVLAPFAAQSLSLAELNTLVPLRADGLLTGFFNKDGKREYLLQNLNLKSRSGVFPGTVTGSISAINTTDWQGAFDVSLQGMADRLLSQLTDENLNQFPFIKGELKGGLKLLMNRTGIAFQDIDISLSNTFSEVTLNGAIESFTPFQTQQLIFNFNSNSLLNLYHFPKSSIKYDKPVNGTVAFSNQHGIQKVGLSATIDGNDLTGQLSLQYPDNSKTVRKISGNLSVNKLDLTEILVKPKDTGRFFSEKPISADWLSTTDLDIDLKANQFKNSLLELTRLEADIIVNDGVLDVAAKGYAGQNSMNVNVELKKVSESWHSRLDVAGEQLSLDALDDSVKNEEIVYGIFSVDLNLSADGDSIAEMAANSNGNLHIKLIDAKIDDQYIRFASSDLLLGVIDIANPFTSSSKLVNAECGVVWMEINDGIATMKNGLAMKLGQYTLLGSGTIDFSSEELDIVVSSKARKGLGINSNSLAKIVRIGGTIDESEFIADPTGLLKSGVTIGVALATSGFSLIAQGLLDKLKANSDVCQIAQNSG